MPPPTLRGRSKTGLSVFKAKALRNMISVAEAIQIVIDETQPLPIEEVQLAHALHRVLAKDVIADLDMPPFDRAQMDGYAVRAEDVTTAPTCLKIVGESIAGKGWHHEMSTGQAVRIMP